MKVNIGKIIEERKAWLIKNVYLTTREKLPAFEEIALQNTLHNETVFLEWLNNNDKLK
jgi:hypothetical protein